MEPSYRIPIEDVRPWPFWLVGALAVVFGTIAGGLLPWATSFYVIRFRSSEMATLCGLGAVFGFLGGWLWRGAMLPPKMRARSQPDRDLPWLVFWGMFWGLVAGVPASAALCLAMMLVGWRLWPGDGRHVWWSLAAGGGASLVAGMVGGLLMLAAERLADSGVGRPAPREGDG